MESVIEIMIRGESELKLALEENEFSLILLVSGIAKGGPGRSPTKPMAGPANRATI